MTHNLNFKNMDHATPPSGINPAAVAVLVAALFLVPEAPVVAGSEVLGPLGYRMDNYRAPVPATLAGATTVSTRRLKSMVDAGGVVLVDVLPAPREPPNIQPGVPWMPVPHRNIPGSIWLPDVGRGKIHSIVADYFRDNLVEATGGDKARAVVIYCQADCWMSWNAAKRATEWGYENIIWFPEGTDGWKRAGHDLVDATPMLF